MRLLKYALPNFVFKVTAAMLVTSLVPAYGYVDPGSGSVIVTTILGILAAIGYTFRKYFYKLRRLITRKKKEVLDEDDTEN